MGFNGLNVCGDNIPIPQKLVFGRILHEMTRVQESESGSHFDRDVS